MPPDRVPFPELDVHDLVAWRMGMAQHAPFVAGLDPSILDRVRRNAVSRLGPEHPMLVPSILVLTAIG